MRRLSFFYVIYLFYFEERPNRERYSRLALILVPSIVTPSGAVNPVQNPDSGSFLFSWRWQYWPSLGILPNCGHSSQMGKFEFGSSPRLWAMSSVMNQASVFAVRLLFFSISRLLLLVLLVLQVNVFPSKAVRMKNKFSTKNKLQLCPQHKI